MEITAVIVLDTHVFVWNVSGDARIGKDARKTIDRFAKEDRVLVSAITPWEIALLVKKRRLRLSYDVEFWLQTSLGLPGFRLSPILPEISVDSVRLPGIFHDDPADRLIVATARYHDAHLVTADSAILAYASTGNLKAIDARI